MKSKRLRAAGLGGDYAIGSGTIASITTSTASIAVAYPAGIEAGDLLVILGTTGNAGTQIFASLSGWTQISAGAWTIAFYKIATGSESGSVTVSLSPTSSLGAGAQMFRFRRTSGNRLTVNEYVTNYASTFNQVPPSQLYNGIDLILYIVCQPGVATVTVSSAPTGFTSVSSRTTNACYFSWYAINRGTSNLNGTFSAAVTMRAISINLG